MTTIQPSFSPSTANHLLDSFRESAGKGDVVRVHHDGADWKVIASGTTPSGRTVALLEPEADTQSVFVEALGQAFSRGIQTQVVRELGLGPMPGQPLSSRTVQQALDMAETMQTVMQGVADADKFFTQLQRA